MKKMLFLGIGLSIILLILSYNSFSREQNNWEKQEIIEYFKENKNKFDNICSDLFSMKYEGYVEIKKKSFNMTTNVSDKQLSAKDISLLNNIISSLKEIPVQKLTKTPKQYIYFEFSNGSKDYYYFQGILFAEEFQQTQMEDAIGGNWFWYSIPAT